MLNYRSFTKPYIIAVFKVLRQKACDQDLQPSRPRRELKPKPLRPRPKHAKMGLETEIKFRDSITGNYWPMGRMCTTTAVSVARRSIQEKFSNLEALMKISTCNFILNFKKLVKKCVRLQLSHWIACVG